MIDFENGKFKGLDIDPDVIYKPVKEELNLVFEKIVNVSSKYDKDNQQVLNSYHMFFQCQGKEYVHQ